MTDKMKMITATALSAVAVGAIAFGAMAMTDSGAVENGTDTQLTTPDTQGTTPSVQTPTTDVEAENVDVPPITIDQVELVGFEILPPNSIGTIYMQSQFKNNSDVTLTGIQYTYRIGDDKSYLSSYDTLLPGETGVMVDCFGPESGLPEDVELLAVSYTVRDADGETVYVDYDAKLTEYTWH